MTAFERDMTRDEWWSLTRTIQATGCPEKGCDGILSNTGDGGGLGTAERWVGVQCHRCHKAYRLRTRKGEQP